MQNKLYVTAKVTECKIAGNNVADLFLSMNIYEDIFYYYRTAKLILFDTNDIIRKFPIVGFEDVNFSYQKEGGGTSINKFKIYKIDKDLKTANRENNNNLIILYLISEEAIRDRMVSICKKFEEPPHSTLQYVITTVMKSNKRIDIEPSTNTLKSVFNFWDGSKSIEFLCRHSEGSFPDYIFFENKDGFVFKPLSKIITLPKKEEFTYKKENTATYIDTDIINLQMFDYFNINEMGLNDAFGNTVYKYKDDYYEWTKFEFDFDTVSPFGGYVGGKNQFVADLKHFNNFILTYQNNEHLAKRFLLLKQMFKYGLIVKIQGNPDRTAGDVFKLNYLPREREKSDLNEMLSGNWLATNINHEITRSGDYIQNIKLVKNGFASCKTTGSLNGAINA